MYYLTKFCCICLNENGRLKKFYKFKNSYKKLTVLMLPELSNDSSIKNQALVCKKCRNYINEIYSFREKCIKNLWLYENYVNQLQLSNEPASNLSIHITNSLDAKQNDSDESIKPECTNEPVEAIEFIKMDNAVIDNIKTEYESLDEVDESRNYESCGYALENLESVENYVKQEAMIDEVENTESFEVSNYSEFGMPLKCELHTEEILSDLDDLERETLSVGDSLVNKNILEVDNMVEYILDSNHTIENTQSLNSQENDSDEERYVQFTINGHKNNFVKDYFNKIMACNVQNNFESINGLENYKNKCDKYEKQFNKFLESNEIGNNSVSDKSVNTTEDVSPQINGLVKKTKMFKGKYKCKVCKRLFRSKNILNKHVLNHKKKGKNNEFDPKKYQCQICNKVFPKKYKLLIHSYRHTGISIYKCDICNKICVSREKLDKHMKQHLFQCHDCNRVFNYACTLKTHCCLMRQG